MYDHVNISVCENRIFNIKYKFEFSRVVHYFSGSIQKNFLGNYSKNVLESRFKRGNMTALFRKYMKANNFNSGNRANINDTISAASLI